MNFYGHLARYNSPCLCTYDTRCQGGSQRLRDKCNRTVILRQDCYSPPPGPGRGKRRKALGRRGYRGRGGHILSKFCAPGRAAGTRAIRPLFRPGGGWAGGRSRASAWSPGFRGGAQRAPLSWFCPSVGAHSVRPLDIGSRFLRRGGYYPPAVYHLRCMLLFSGADYLAEAPEQVIEQNGSDNVPAPFMRLPRRQQVPGYQKNAPGSGPAGGISPYHRSRTFPAGRSGTGPYEGG